MHSWIPRRIGNPPDGSAEALEYWLSEGFTDFYAERTLLKSASWSLEEFVSDLNDMLLAYDTSAARNLPNARIEKEFWTNNTVQQLSHQRGMLFAYLLDHRIRQASGGRRNLDNVIVHDARRVRRCAGRSQAGPVVNFRRALQSQTGAGFAPEMARYIYKGETIVFPDGLFGRCAEIRNARIGLFDKGFDVDKTAASGVFTGVDRQGPAYAAGIREGMRRLAWLGGKPGDSRVEWSYRVGDGKGKTFVVRYKPAGKQPRGRSEVVLTPRLTLAQGATCRRSMSGG